MKPNQLDAAPYVVLGELINEEFEPRQPNRLEQAVVDQMRQYDGEPEAEIQRDGALGLIYHIVHGNRSTIRVVVRFQEYANGLRQYDGLRITETNRRGTYRIETYDTGGVKDINGDQPVFLGAFRQALLARKIATGRVV